MWRSAVSCGVTVTSDRVDVDEVVDVGRVCLTVCACVCPGALSNPVVTVAIDLAEVRDVRYGNARMLPRASTLRPLPWAAGGRHRVGEYLCEMAWMPSYRDGAPQAACPRYLARRQLRRLDDLGLRLYSAFEAEFTVLRRADHRPIFGGHT